ncbi:Putative ubiquitin carboxyl-terminal hydrolase 50 [Heterocephalus glaber]|uniref:ubiquitinyl hydrolase 1 n=1 Tax=Heterocephalus glaber TaxID=10181 RepID=G5C8T0_HETGA|nr:Putative ubiquitin carboxyl-terminal hydrolase 50 [Heterocephalus glaber]
MMLNHSCHTSLQRAYVCPCSFLSKGLTSRGRRRGSCELTFTTRSLTWTSRRTLALSPGSARNTASVRPVNHFGDLDGGYYTAFCRNSATQAWYSFDDTRVSEIPDTLVQTTTAYLLFYSC